MTDGRTLTMRDAVLAVDIGTSSLKAALIDAGGTVIASVRRRFPASPRIPLHWTEAFRAAADALVDAASREKADARANIVAVAVSGNGPTLVASSPRGDGPILLWNDPIDAISAQGAASTQSATGTQGATGTQSATGTQGAGRSLFIPRIDAFRRLFPADYDAARWIISGPEYLVFALTGEAVTLLPDPRYRETYWTDEALARAGLDAAKMPPFVPLGAIAGTCGASGTCGGASGLPSALAGIPVVACGPDFLVALAGTGAIKPGLACDRAGTSEGLNVCIASPVAAPDIRVLPSIISGLWNASYLLPETGKRFHEYRAGAGLSLKGYPEIMSEIAASPIAPRAGEALHPGRALVEDIGFSVRRGIDALAAATGFARELRLSGGQARNEEWNRIKADISDATLVLTATADGELMGNAAIAFASLGTYASVTDASDAMVRIARRYEPSGAHRAIYAEKYRAWLEGAR